MELFVVNRHEAEEGNNNTENEERTKLDKFLKKIEKNKKRRSKQKLKEQKIKEAKQKTVQHRQMKREVKAKIIPVPENNNDDFIDASIGSFQDVKNESLNEGPSTKKSKLDLQHLGFTVLGGCSAVSKSKVKRVLPNWLSNPTIISTDLKNLVTKVSDVKQLDKGLRKLLKSNGINCFFPVQATVIPYLLNSIKVADVLFPRDICVSAPTGSGKTLAFALPVIQALKRYSLKKIRALVILPTKDLAVQVYRTFKIYTQNTNIDVCLLTGDHPFVIEQNQLLVENEAYGYISKADILVCTAGRLVDHLKLTKGLDLKHLEYLVIDEADRVLDNVQNDWLYHLERNINREESNVQTGKILNICNLQKHRPPQKLLFSATLSQDPEKLQKLSLFQPKLFTSVVETSEIVTKNLVGTNADTFIGKYTTPKELSEKYVVTSLELKPLCLYKFIQKENITWSIVFTHSAESAHRLAILLKALFKDERKVEDISSNLQGKSRMQLIERFCKGEIDVLVCTDALARGIDLPNVQCVISYSAPKHLKTYIHRAGRTARAGENGVSVTMLTKSQVAKFRSMLNQADKTDIEEVSIPEDDLEPLGEQYKESLRELKEIVDKEEKTDLQKILSAKRRKTFKKN